MRRFLFAIAIAATLTACREHSSSGSIRVDPALESLVPDDTLFIMGADVDAIRNTSVYRKHIGIVDLPRLNEFTQKTGVDPRKDLAYVLSTSNGKTGVFMARGKFRSSDLEAQIDRQGVRRFAYKGHNFFGDERSAVTFINSSTALLGSTEVLKSIVDNSNSSHHGLPQALGQRVASIQAGSQMWAAFIGGVQGLNVTVPENSNLAGVIRVFKGMDSAALGMDLRNGCDLHGDAMCKTEADAQRLRAALKGIIGLGRLSTPDNQPELLKLYDAIQVDQDQTKVTVAAHVPLEMVDRFVDLWIKRR
jgi:hypothetical protein